MQLTLHLAVKRHDPDTNPRQHEIVDITEQRHVKGHDFTTFTASTASTAGRKSPTPKPGEGQVHPTARSGSLCSPNGNAIRPQVRTESTAPFHSGENNPGEGQVHPTARSSYPSQPNINENRLRVHAESTALARFGRKKTGSASPLPVFSRIAFIAATLLAASCAAQTPKPTAPAGSLKSILANARAQVEQSDVRASGHLVQVAASGARTNNTLALASHSFPDGLRTLITVTTPDHTRVRYLLTQDEFGHASIEALRKTDKAPVRLAPDRWGENVAGTLFYPEDFANGQFFWSRQTVLPPAKYGARDCFVLRSEPGPGEPTQYASVTSWIDQKTGSPVYVEAVPKNGGPTKQFVFYSLEQIGGLWLSRQIEVKLAGRSGSSLLLIDHGSPHAHLTRKDFNLTAPAGGDAVP